MCALEIHISVSNTSSQILPVTRTILHCIILGQGLGTRNFFPLDFNFSSFLSSFIMAMRLDGLFSFSTQVILWRVRTLKTANKWPPQIASDLIQNVVKFFLPIFPPSSNVTLLRLCTAQCWLNKKWRPWYFNHIAKNLKENVETSSPEWKWMWFFHHLIKLTNCDHSNSGDQFSCPHKSRNTDLVEKFYPKNKWIETAQLFIIYSSNCTQSSNWLVIVNDNTFFLKRMLFVIYLYM